MTHTGRVREIRNDLALVEVEAARCEACPGRNACSGLTEPSAGKRLLEAENTAGALPGDLVEVEWKPLDALRAAFLAFLFPVALMGAGYVLLCRGNTLRGALGAFMGLIAGFGVFRVAGRIQRARPGHGLMVSRVLASGERGDEETSGGEGDGSPGFPGGVVR